MAEAGYRQQRDHRAVVRQRIHAAAGHRRHAVQDVQRNVCRVGGGDKGIGHGRQGDTHPAGGRAGDPGQRRDANRFIQQRIGNGRQPLRQHQKTRQRRNHRPEAVFRGGIHRREYGAADGGAAPFRQPPAYCAKAADQHHRDAQQQRRLHRPDSGDLLNVSFNRRRQTRQHQLVGGAVPLGDPAGKQQVEQPHEDQRRDRQQRMRQTDIVRRFRLIFQVRTVAFALRRRPAALALQVDQANGK
ncbi:Uncharacterised protein [Pluralibacter gergoviae]|nr:Uncharacterised protein [Pluralibacter gergoviae]